MLYNYASEIPNAVIYPIFKGHIVGCSLMDNPSQKRAALKVLGHVADSDGLLDCIKDDCEELTKEIILKGL